MSAFPATEPQRRWSSRRQRLIGVPRTRDANKYPRGLRRRYIGDKMRGAASGGSRNGEREVGMSGHRRLVAVGAAATLALLGGGTAFAATPQEIYRDLADNGRLDGRYTRAEVERAFNLPPV